MRLELLLFLCVLAGCGGVAREPAALDQGALLAASCSGCHAAGGQEIIDLSGMTAAELEAALLTFRSEPVGPTAMHRMARGYSDQQFALIAQALGVGE